MENKNLFSESGIIITLILILIPVLIAAVIVVLKAYGIFTKYFKKKELEKFNAYLKELSPEERLLRAIFGDKSKDVKDSSLRLPSWQGGKILQVHILKRESWDNLPTWVFKQVKVFVAQTRKIEVWDKMAWRHGNKWIVSRVVPVEDMPFMADGTPVDIILNPLWVVSRMNIWQVLESHMGMAAKKMWITVATPILNGISVDKVTELMLKAWMTSDWKVQLYDGETWEAFKERTMVWVKYMLKLHHLVE